MLGYFCNHNCHLGNANTGKSTAIITNTTNTVKSTTCYITIATVRATTKRN